MKISVLNISAGVPGVMTVGVPQGSRLQSAVEMSGVVQVYYSYDGNAQPEEPVELRIVDNLVDYDDDFAYLSVLVNPQNRQVSHLVYRSPSVHVQPH